MNRVRDYAHPLIRAWSEGEAIYCSLRSLPVHQLDAEAERYDQYARARFSALPFDIRGESLASRVDKLMRLQAQFSGLRDAGNLEILQSLIKASGQIAADLSLGLRDINHVKEFANYIASKAGYARYCLALAAENRKRIEKAGRISDGPI